MIEEYKGFCDRYGKGHKRKHALACEKCGGRKFKIEPQEIYLNGEKVIRFLCKKCAGTKKREYLEQQRQIYLQRKAKELEEKIKISKCL